SLHLTRHYLFTAAATPELYTLSLHDALPIYLDLILEMRAATAARRVLGPRIFTAGPILDDAPGDWPLRMRVKTAQDGTAVKIRGDRKSTRLNSSHVAISYAVFCLKKKKTQDR